MPKYEDMLEANLEFLMQGVAKVRCAGSTSQSWADCKDEVSEETRGYILWMAASRSPGPNATTADIVVTWRYVWQQYRNYRPGADNPFGQCYASSWWQPERPISGGPFQTYSNGTKLSAADVDLFQRISPGGKGFLLSPKMPFW